jgi:hypothetical protein
MYYVVSSVMVVNDSRQKNQEQLWGRRMIVIVASMEWVWDLCVAEPSG